MSSCDPIRTDLVAFDRDELTPAEAAVVRSHVENCRACAAELAALRRTVALFDRATAIEPTPASSARLRRSVDAALESSRAARPQPAPTSALERARATWHRSAAVRRFAFASLGLHAAAAALLVALLARSDAPGVVQPSIDWRIDDPPTLPGDDIARAAPRSALPAFDVARPEGVETAAAPGRRFPNTVSAVRAAAAATDSGRRAALRASLGDDADRAAGTLDRGLEWLAIRRGRDGRFGGGADAVETAAASVLAFAWSGRVSVDDAGLGMTVAWIDDVARDASVETGERALAARALAAQFVADFGSLARDRREERAHRLRGVAESLATAQNADGGFGVRHGAPSDITSTVAAFAALADVRTAGAADTAPALASASRWIESRRAVDGRVMQVGAADPVEVTARLVATTADAGARPVAETAVRALEDRMGALATSPRGAAAGVEALAALGRSVRPAVRAVLDGPHAAVRATDPARRREEAVETAWSMVAVARTLRP